MRNGIESEYYTRNLSHHSFINNLDNNNSFVQIDPVFLRRWKKPGDELYTDIPAYNSNFLTNMTDRALYYYTYGDLNVHNASFIKLRDATITYKLSDPLLSYLRVDHIVLRAQVSNLMLWKANKVGIDPEYQDLGRGLKLIDRESVGALRLGENAFSFALSINF